VIGKLTTPRNLKIAGLTVLFLALSQLLFWPVVDYAERLARPDQIDQRETIMFQPLDAQRKVMPGGAALTAKRQKQQGYYAPLVPGAAYARVTIPFDASGDSRNLGFYMSLRDDVVEIRLNDMIIQPEVTVSRQQGSLNVGPHFVPLPPAAIRQGKNALVLDVLTTGSVNDFPTFAIGDADDLSSAHRWRNLIALDLPLAGVAVLFFAVLLCAVVDWPKEDRPRIRAIMLLLGLSAASTAVLSYIPQDWPFAVTIGLYLLSSAGIGLSALQYAHSDGSFSFVPARLMRWSWLALPVLVALPLLWASFDTASAALLISGMLKISFWFVSILCLVAATMLALATVRSGWASWLERLLLILCLSFFALDRLGSIFELHSLLDPEVPLTLPWSPIIGVPLGLSIIVSLARQAAEARKTVTQSNEILAARLEDQDAKLERAYDAQKQMLQRQVMLEERQRIVRDMHDGIGGQLLGLMMQVRSGGVEQKQVEEGLQSSIADLRLIVDSMDTAEDGLAETLRSFEHRVRAQVEAAGMTFTVAHGLDDGKPGPGPRPSLQILRILQEAVTNAMRHSGAQEIALESRYGQDGTICIAVRDNGRGMPAEIKGGRGLASMRSRAEAVGGTLTVDSSAAGTRLELTLPEPE
jgi:two-component system sensor histidine kinase UhpB